MMTSTSIHETRRRLRALGRHLDRHPCLPAVTSAGSTFSAALEVTVASEVGTAGFLAWAATLEHPRVRAFGANPVGVVMLRCDGRIDGDAAEVTAHVEDLPAAVVRAEPIPLLGFRHLLAQTGWGPQGGQEVC